MLINVFGNSNTLRLQEKAKSSPKPVHEKVKDMQEQPLNPTINGINGINESSLPISLS